jgi:hypothetical protein
MLAGQQEVIVNAKFKENLAPLVEAFDGSVNGCQGILVNLGMADEVAKFHKGAHSTNHLWWDVANNSW